MLEAAEIGVERVQRHLHGIEREAGIQHRKMNLGILMPGEPDEANFPVFLSFFQSLGCTALADEEFGIVIKGHTVDLPQIKAVGLQSAQGFFEH
ncbi:MAG: hypothetical protein ABSE28_13325 [Candidatus Sulfotelmatobacter sp.]